MIDTKIVLKNFGEELSYRLDEKGINYRQAAFATRVTKAEMSEYLRGRAFPEIWSISLIADYLGCTVNEMLGYPNTPYERACEDIVRATIAFPNRDVFADHFRERLMNRIEQKHLSINELSEHTGITKETINRYLSVHRWVPRVPELLAICSALDCTPSDLLGY